jgi:hypothetical protein
MKRSKIDPRELLASVVSVGTVVLAVLGYHFWLAAQYGPGRPSERCPPVLNHGKPGPVGLAIAVGAGIIVSLLQSREHSGNVLLAIAVGAFGFVGIVELVEWIRVLGSHGCFY